MKSLINLFIVWPMVLIATSLCLIGAILSSPVIVVLGILNLWLESTPQKS